MIDAVGELHLVAPARGPGRRRIRRRHRLWRLSRIDRRVLALQRREVFTDRALGLLLVAPVDVAALDPLVAAGVGLDHAGIDRKAFAADQPDLHARRHHALAHQPKRGALTEAAMAVDRERRMVRHCFFEAKPAEPPVGEIEPDLVAQSPLGTNRVAIADQHPDHQLQIHRRAADLAVERLELLTDQVEIGQRIQLANRWFAGTWSSSRKCRTAAPDPPPTDPSSPHPIAIDPTATKSRLRQAPNTPFSTAPARSGC